MRGFLVLLLTASVGCIQERAIPVPRLLFPAATPAQIHFANMMKYDDTGPGAKDPNSNLAYQTYKTLDEALVAYLDDPDTKLPESERAQAIESLNGLKSYPLRYLHPKKIEYVPSKYFEFQGPKPVDLSEIRSSYIQGYDHLKNIPTYQSPFRWQKLKEVRPVPVSISHYTRLLDDQLQGQATADDYDNAAETAAGVSKALASPYRGYFKYRDNYFENTQQYTDYSKHQGHPYAQ